MSVAESEVREALRELASVTKWVEGKLSLERLRSFRGAFGKIEECARELEPNLQFWDAEPVDAASETWNGIAEQLATSDAKELSAQLVAVSNHLTSGFKALRQENRQREALCVSDAVGYLYADLLRPLWKAFPELLPDEMKR
jgi:hypothetical protein